MIDEEAKRNSLNRLKRIEGQVKGLMRMVENEEYCIDLVNQVNAIRRALEQVALIVMRRHIESCVVDACKEGGGEDKLDELIKTLDKFIK